MQNAECNKFIKNFFSEKGVPITDSEATALTAIYQSCQEWDDGKMLTGTTEDELEDFLLYSPCIEEVISKKGVLIHG